LYKKIRTTVFPIIAAMIWGFCFSAQQKSALLGVDAFTFNAYRSLIATVALFFVAAIFARGFKKLFAQLKNRAYLKDLLLGGLFCGIALFVSASLQQASLSYSEPGKVGFITVFYVIFVPILGVFLKKKAPISVWIAVIIALLGLYFLCIKDYSHFELAFGDGLALLCALCYSVHILVIDKYTSKVDGIQLSFMQFAVMTVLSFCASFIFGTPPQSAIIASIPYIAFAGIFSSGIAFTLQILAQKDSNPTVVSILFSLESVFAVIGGALFAGEVMTPREYLGCVIMFCAVILAQLPMNKKKSEKKL